MMDRGTVRNMYNFIPKNKFEKLVHLVGFIIRIYHDARSPERQINSVYVWVGVTVSICTEKWYSASLSPPNIKINLSRV